MPRSICGVIPVVVCSMEKQNKIIFAFNNSAYNVAVLQVVFTRCLFRSARTDVVSSHFLFVFLSIFRIHSLRLVLFKVEFIFSTLISIRIYFTRTSRLKMAKIREYLFRINSMPKI